MGVVIPVYNVEQYLETCLDSVLRQTMLPAEIVLVNDGSIDGSGIICDRYAEKYPELIKVIHWDNGGLSRARNTGIENCSADYILFLDSDDTIEKNACEQFNKILSQTDAEVVTANITSFRPTKTVTKKHSSVSGHTYLGKDFLKFELQHKTMIYESPHCIYKRSFLWDNGLLFEPDILHEDQLFTTKVFLTATKVYVSDVNFYCHLIRDDSISTQKNQLPNAESIIKICYIEEIIAAELEDELHNLIVDHCVDLYYRVFVHADLLKHPNIRLEKMYLKNNGVSIKNRLRYAAYSTSEKLFVRLQKIVDKSRW